MNNITAKAGLRGGRAGPSPRAPRDISAGPRTMRRPRGAGPQRGEPRTAAYNTNINYTQPLISVYLLTVLLKNVTCGINSLYSLSFIIVGRLSMPSSYSSMLICQPSNRLNYIAGSLATVSREPQRTAVLVAPVTGNTYLFTSLARLPAATV